MRESDLSLRQICLLIEPRQCETGIIDLSKMRILGLLQCVKFAGKKIPTVRCFKYCNKDNSCCASVIWKWNRITAVSLVFLVRFYALHKFPQKNIRGSHFL